MIIIIVCSILMVIGGVLFFRSNNIQSNKHKKLSKIRNNIARDLHDDVGATLSSISFYAQAVQQRIEHNKNQEALQILTQMGESARQTVESMSDIVWMVNPANDSLENLFVKIEDYAKQMCASNQIEILFSNTTKNIQKIDLLKRRDIYLICKEAINNAVKYAKATSISVELGNTHEHLLIKIKDDGLGFNKDTIKMGNGLLNMKVRTSEIGGVLLLNSNLNEGTEIMLKIPLNTLNK